jgi:hypothetical protein
MNDTLVYLVILGLIAFVAVTFTFDLCVGAVMVCTP